MLISLIYYWYVDHFWSPFWAWIDFLTLPKRTLPGGVHFSLDLKGLLLRAMSVAFQQINKSSKWNEPSLKLSFPFWTPLVRPNGCVDQPHSASSMQWLAPLTRSTQRQRRCKQHVDYFNWTDLFCRCCRENLYYISILRYQFYWIDVSYHLHIKIKPWFMCN